MSEAHPPMVTARDVRDRLRSESVRMGRLVAKELKRPRHKQRKHIIDGLEVAQQVLRNLAAELAREAQTDSVLTAAFEEGDDDDDDDNPAGP